LSKRRKLVELLDFYENKTLSWDELAKAVQQTHQRSLGQLACRQLVPNKPKKEDYFYANPYECLSNVTGCGIVVSIFKSELVLTTYNIEDL
jgi:rhamnogalacturonan I rhamnosyltransferase